MNDHLETLQSQWATSERTGDVAVGTRAGATRRVSRAQRVANAMLARMLRRGRGPAFMQLLTVRGRHTGTSRTTPVVPVIDDGRVWVVSPFGEVEWVRNARAAGRVQLGRGDDRIEYDARELDAHEATPVLRRYLSMPSERFVRRDFNVSSTSDDAAIEADAARHPVFALTRVAPRTEGANGLGRVGCRG